MTPSAPPAQTLLSTPPVGWLLASRFLLFAGLQLLVAAGLSVAGDPTPVTSSGRWWLMSVTGGNLATIALLSRARRDGGGVRSLWRFSRATWRGDLAWFLAFAALAGPVGWLPNLLLAKSLWVLPDTGNAFLFRPLPLPVLIVLAAVFPVSHALSELPLYFGHVGPTLRERGWPAWATVALPALVLSMQHLVMPLALDARYLVWRGLMFLPFALAVGIVLHHRPTVRPWLLVMHGFMDAQLPVLTWLTSTGALTFQT